VGDIIRTADAYDWSISRLAEALKKDRRTIARIVQESGISPAGSRRGNPIYSLADVFDAMDRGSRPQIPEGLDVDDLAPQERRAWFQSENERVKLERELRSLVPVEEVQREMSTLAKAVASGLDSLADMLERDAGLPPEAIDLVEKTTDALREQMYRAIIADDDDEDAANG